MMTMTLIMTIVSCGVSVGVILFALIDRSARADAWRRIAEGRRYNAGLVNSDDRKVAGGSTEARSSLP